MIDFLKIPIESKVCLTPSQCYPVTTNIPSWITLILIGSVFLIAKNIYERTK